jgi:hypothetical protein
MDNGNQRNESAPLFPIGCNFVIDELLQQLSGAPHLGVASNVLRGALATIVGASTNNHCRRLQRGGVSRRSRRDAPLEWPSKDVGDELLLTRLGSSTGTEFDPEQTFGFPDNGQS